ncbi:uncharacterized protein FA14DRAFT_176178 [Meira miltonrushii]|uniref:Uncharacterized protein n=1 Tax=Meira miltonrushii TaxID=1280837 RepID=A0A316VMT9_9BASI|nr:uncharacterized protein FA14DRAFT_176178 [Meira miltonrushii]PWN36875.1 hypothetical protein FA14DRAFT_176178 [Meira miltonrushii]
MDGDRKDRVDESTWHNDATHSKQGMQSTRYGHKAPRRISDPIKRIQKHKTVQERVQAKRKSEKRYQTQFTDKGIEKAKLTLKGAELETFLQKAKHYREVKRKASDKITEKRRKAAYLASKPQTPSKFKDSPAGPRDRAANQIPSKSKNSPAGSRDRAANLRAANEAAMSQLSARPRFMQKVNEAASSGTDKGKV